MHQIPCSGCAFFTEDFHLKCTVNPDIALSEKAIGCADYEPDDGRYSVINANTIRLS